MEVKGNISQYRGRLDKTLASHDLTNEETIKTLVKDQMLRSSHGIEEYTDNVVEKRTKEVLNLVGMLRSASVNDDMKYGEATHGGWKIKQDTKEIRVMYREGPEGTPFHTLLAEGYVDGPMDVCLCISWESSLYKKWWPQTTVPAFRIISSRCLQKIRIGEQISLVRMKVSWPLFAREALIHYFEFEYFQDGLTIVVLNSISDLESVDRSTHGFTTDGIPDAQDVVRIDVVGGFALQKVTAGRSYFRTIANMDIKLDFVPPAFINFVARQLIGSGFRLYQKEVAAVSKGDDDFGKALKDPLYTRIRDTLYSDNISREALEPEDHKNDACINAEEHPMKSMRTEEENMDKKVLSDDSAVHSASEDTMLVDQKASNEIEEIEEEQIEEAGHLEEDSQETYNPPINQIAETCHINNKKEFVISPEVEQALGTLDRVISIFREYGFNSGTRSPSGIKNEKFPKLQKDVVEESNPSENDQLCSGGGVYVELLKNESMDRTVNEPRNSSASHGSRCIGPNPYAREGNHNRIAPASPGENSSNSGDNHQTALCSSTNEMTEMIILEKITNGNNLVTADVNGIHGNSLTKEKNKKLRHCCLPFSSKGIMSRHGRT